MAKRTLRGGSSSLLAARAMGKLGVREESGRLKLYNCEPYHSICTRGIEHGLRDILGIVRLPRNLINGVRSACAAAAEACRRAFVANIFELNRA